MSFSVNISITGDCSNNSSGVINVVPTGGTSPYVLTWINPNFGSFTSTTAFTFSSLSADSYNFGVFDTNIISPNSSSFDFILSSGFCINQQSFNTTCGLDNGALTVSANSISLPIKYTLYSQTIGYVTEIDALNTEATFTALPPDIYYVDVKDFSNCTGTTASCVIIDSGDLEFDLFSIDNSNCSNIPSGKIYVYNETGSGPFTYSWSPGLETTKSISGLSSGSYSVTVTDSQGCSKTKSVTITDVPLIAVTGFIAQKSPDCWQSNGVLEVFVTGGTPPYLYQLNSYPPKISLSTSETFSGLSAGVYNVQVTDAGLCFASGSTTLQTPDSFTNVIVNVTPSYCNNNSGEIEIILVGGATPYNFELTDTSGNTQVISTVSPVGKFINLPTGSYHIKITNPSACSYETDVVINNINKFEIATSVINTSCGNSNGSITIDVNSAGTYSYFIDNQSFLNTNQLNHTFNNLSSGIYNVEVKDNSGCSQKTIVNVGSSSNVNFTLIPSGCGLGSEGTITTVITSGQPPFTYNWTPNVGQTGIYLTGLTAGTYTLQLIDDNGCSTTKSTTVECLKRYFAYEVYELCDGNFVSSSATKNGIFEMFHQGYLDLTSGETNCKLNIAEFTLNVDVGGTGYTKDFFTSTNLNSFPTDDDYINALKEVLESIDGIGVVIINKNDNSIKVSSDCSKILSGKNIKVDLSIDYFICCVEPTPTPTNTSTQTQTPTQTATPTTTPLPQMCFQYYGLGNEGTTTQQCYVSAEPTLFDGKSYWIISGCPTVEITPGSNCPSILGYIFWQGDRWFHATGLGSGTYYSYLMNPGPLPIAIPGIYDWFYFGSLGTCNPVVNNSSEGPCVTPTPTQTPTPNETPTQTPTPNETPTPTPTPNETPTQTPTSITPTPTSTQTPTPTETPTQTPTQTTTTSSTPTMTQTQTQTQTLTPTPSITPDPCSVGSNCCDPVISNITTTFGGDYQLYFSNNLPGDCNCNSGVIVYYKKSYNSSYTSQFKSILGSGPYYVDVTNIVNSLPVDWFPIDFKIVVACSTAGNSIESPVFQFEPCVTYQAVGGTQSITGRLCSSSTPATYTVFAGNCVCIKGFASYSPGTFTPNTSQYCRTGFCTPGCISCQS